MGRGVGQICAACFVRQNNTVFTPISSRLVLKQTQQLHKQPVCYRALTAVVRGLL
jgi:hypothetical protein